MKGSKPNPMQETLMTPGDKIATRQAYGDALVALGAEHPELVVLDADLSSSTQTKKFAQAYPDRFFNMGIAEQNMMGTAAGLASMGKVPFVSSFAMFATGRAWEQVRNSIAHNRFNVKIAASHAGITLGEDGATHQTVEDIALMNVIPAMSVMVPADAVEVKAMLPAMLTHDGATYLRLGRPPVPVIHDPATYEFRFGKANVVRAGSDATVVALGIMVSVALQVADELALEGTELEVINLSTVKPLDVETIAQSVDRTSALVVAEEHNRLGGVNQMVAGELLRHGIGRLPMEVVAIEDRYGQSGKVADLLEEYGLTPENLKLKVREALRRK